MVPERWPEDFALETLYLPEAWFVHRVIDIDATAGTVLAEMDTNRLMLVAEQRELPGHPKHVPAAVVIQASGTMGQLYAVYALGLRATEGWVGFGTHITKARWGRIGHIGPPVTLHATCTRRRELWGTTFCDFTFRFTQLGEVVYQSQQTAAWKRVLPPDQGGQSPTRS